MAILLNLSQNFSGLNNLLIHSHFAIFGNVGDQHQFHLSNFPTATIDPKNFFNFNQSKKLKIQLANIGRHHQW